MSGGFKEPQTWESAHALLQKSYRGYLDLIQQRIKKLKPGKEDRQRFNALLGTAPDTGPLRLSNLLARFEFAEYVAAEVRHLSAGRPDLDFYHLTLLADEGIMSDREPLFPLRLMKQKTNKAMRKADLEGIYVVEVQPLINWPQKGEGRALLAHVHVLGWKRTSPDNSAEDIRRALGYDKRRRNLAWSCQFGADPIVVRHLTVERGCPSFWAAYLLKAPHSAKSLIPRKNYDPSSRKSRLKFRTTTLGYRGELAMRLLELGAQLPIFAPIGGVGAGASMVGRCKNRLKLWDTQRRAEWKREGREPVPAFDEREFWERTHKRRRARYLAFFIDGPTIPQRPPQRRK